MPKTLILHRRLTALGGAVALTFASLATTGCTTTTYSDAQVQFKRTAFLTKAVITKLEKTKDGILLEGYANDQVAGIAAITKAAVEGAVKGALPVP